MSRSFLFYSYTLFLFLPGFAQADATIGSLVAETLAKNPEIAYYEAAIAVASGQRLDAGKLPNPELTTQLGRWSPAAGDGLSWQAGVSQTFEWPGRLALRKAIADRSLDIARIGLDAFKASLAAKARSLAVSMLMAQEKAAAAEAAVTRVSGVLGVLVQRDPGSPAPLLETRILEANAITLTRQASQARQAFDTARVELNLLRSASPDTAITISTEALQLPAPPALPKLLAAADRNNFDIRTRQVELQQQGFAVSLARNEQGPAITVAPFVAGQKAGADKESTAGLSVSIPLPLWNRNKANVAIANARQQQAETSLLVTVRDIGKQVALHSLAYGHQAAEMAQWRPDVMKTFREAAESADRHYQLGAIPVSTYLEMQKSDLEALDALQSTQAEALESLHALESLTGLNLRTSTK
jgi:cobalt-zinc-cadmium efflux system outer membrane protein